MARRLQKSSCSDDTRLPAGGFTLVELVIVMAIIVSVVVAAFGSLHSVMRMYKNSLTRQKLLAIQKGLLEYYKESMRLRRECRCRNPFPNNPSFPLTGLGVGSRYRAGYNPQAFFSVLANYIKVYSKNPAVDGWNRYFVVLVNYGSWSGVYCAARWGNCQRNGYMRNYCPTTWSYSQVPKVLIMSLGENERLDTDLTRWTQAPVNFAGDDMGIVVVPYVVDRGEGVDYTESTLSRLGTAAVSYFLQKQMNESYAKGGIDQTILNTNWWITASTTDSSVLNSIVDFTTIGYVFSELRDYWGNVLNWNPRLRSSPPFTGRLSSPCGFDHTVVATM